MLPARLIKLGTKSLGHLSFTAAALHYLEYRYVNGTHQMIDLSHCAWKVTLQDGVC